MQRIHWIPAEGMRHAVLDRTDVEPPDPDRIDTLCGHHLKARDDELAWLWQTCGHCLREAHHYLANRQRTSG